MGKKRIKRGHNGLLSSKQADALLSLATLNIPGARCACCETRPAAFGGIFIPHDQKLYCAPEGKFRVVRYSLCKECVEDLKHSMAIVEQKYLNELQASVSYKSVTLEQDGNFTGYLHLACGVPIMN